jgi:chromosome segregation ATPase
LFDLIRDNVLRREPDVFTKIKLVGMLRGLPEYQSQQGIRNDQNQTSVSEIQKLKPPRESIREELNVAPNFISMADLYNNLPPEKQQEVMDWYRQQEKPSQKELEGKIREVSELKSRLSSVEGENRVYQKRIDALNEQLSKLKRLESEEAKIKETLDQIHELEKRKTYLFKDAESTKVVHQVLVRSREFFTRECMQIPALKLRPESVKVMQQDFEGLVELVENWLEAIKGRFIV